MSPNTRSGSLICGNSPVSKLKSLVGENCIASMIDLAKTTPEGCFIEVGVYKGGTAQYLENLAANQNRLFYAYDTFTGIPYQDLNKDILSPGHFGDTSYEQVKANLPDTILIKGIFPQCAVPMPKVAFVNLDCDQYQSYIDSVKYIEPMMVKGGVMWFDDYEHLVGAKIAIDELFGDRLLRDLERPYVRF